MSKKWPMVRLDDLLIKSNEWIDLLPDEEYVEVTVRLWGKGVKARGKVMGSQVGTSKRQVVHAGEFILSRIDARNGALGLVPASLEGAIVTNDFPAFGLRLDRIEPKFLEWMSKTTGFVDLCLAASEGTTNRVRLKEVRFLNMHIPLPPLDEQRRIVARIDELAAKIEQTRELRTASSSQVDSLILTSSIGVFTNLLSSCDSLPISQVASIRSDLIRPLDGKKGELRFVGLQHIESHTGKKLGEDWLQAEQLDGRKFRFSPNEIVYGYLRPYLNKVWVADCEGVCSVDQYVLRVNERVAVPKYLAHYMRSKLFLQETGDLTNNLMLPRLRSGLLGKIVIPIPSLSRQRHIVEYLNQVQSKVDALKQLQAKTAAELNALLPSILDKAFKGEL